MEIQVRLEQQAALEEQDPGVISDHLASPEPVERAEYSGSRAQLVLVVAVDLVVQLASQDQMDLQVRAKL